MIINKRVEAVAETIRMISPDFTIAKSWQMAAKIVEVLDSVPEQEVCEPS
jgi:hypothetical protein